MVHSSQVLEEQEEEGICNLVLVAVEYVGAQSSIAPNTLRNQFAWPGSTALQRGQPQLGLVPDWTDDEYESRTIDGLFGRDDFDVIRDPQKIAEILLERNYLPTDVFDAGYSPRKREALFDLLDLEDKGAGNDEKYREQLRDVAGIDVDKEKEKEIARSTQRVERLLEQNTWDELQSAADRLGYDIDEDTPKPELAEWLADQQNEIVNRALDDPYFTPDIDPSLMNEYANMGRKLVSVVAEMDHPFDNPTHQDTETLAEFLASQDDQERVQKIIVDKVA